MAENVYLVNLRAQYDQLKKSIAGLQARAAEAKRDLMPEELRSIIEMGEKAQGLFTQIESLTEIELRNASVEAMNARVQAAITESDNTGDNTGDGTGAGTGDNTGGNGQFRSLGGATAQDRDPGFYVRGSQFSYVSDHYRSMKFDDRDAKERLTKHTNALRGAGHLRDVLGTTTGGGVGLVPPVWLADQFAPILHRKLRVAALLRQVPWAGPYPWTIPVASTAATSTNVNEGSNPSESDPTYTTITVLPVTISGYSEVSRQLLEGSNPAVDAIIWGDMMGNWLDNAETNTITAIEGQSGINLVTVSGTAIDLMRGGILDGIAAVEDNGAGDADLFFGRRARWHTYLKLADTAGRPIVSNGQTYGPQNAVGLGNATEGFRNTIVGELENLAVATSPTVNASRGYVINSQELLFSMSPPMQFKFEEPAGPALVRVGVWGYMAVVTGRRPKAITRVSYASN